MSCGCNKGKDNNGNKVRIFRDISSGKTDVKKLYTMIQGFALAYASRGLSKEKAPKEIKQLRVLSCFGNESSGGELPPCQHLKPSSTEGKFYCGGCGCGDKKATWLNGTAEEYSKLDFPFLSCPLAMPGFSNYKQSNPDEANEPITRKFYIENMDFTDVQEVEVTQHEFDPASLGLSKQVTQDELKNIFKKKSD